MHQQFYEKKLALNQNINRLNKNNKKQLKKLVSNLIKRREEHEARIERLITKNYLSKDVTKESIKQNQSQFSRILEQLDNNEPILINQGQQSVGAFGSHVNLLATVSLKTDYHLCQKVQEKERGKLLPSLSSFLKINKVVNTLEKEDKPRNLPEYIEQIADYLIEEQISDDVITQLDVQGKQKQNEYFGTRFILGKYEEVHLSKLEVSKEEQKLVLCENQGRDKIINIGWLLFKRLFNDTKTKTFPHALHTLFSYPIKTFNIKNSIELLQFNDLLGQIMRNEPERSQEDISNLKIYGFDENDGFAYEIENISKSKNLKYFKSILNRFDKIIMLDQEQLPVKHIPLSCLQNHFVVVTMTVQNKGEYYISVGQKNENRQFRCYILDSQGNVKYGYRVKNGQFLFCNLNAEEYEIYVSPVAQSESSQNNCEESYELVNDHQENFNLWIQGKQIYSKVNELNLEIRLKEEYNHYTSKIAQKYKNNHIESKIFNEELKCHHNAIVKRQILECLDLYIDTFVFQNENYLTITYKGSHMLCDNHFQHNTIKVVNGQSIVLYKKAKIEKIQVERNGKKEDIDHKIVEFFI